MFGFLPAPCSTCHRAEHDVYRSYFCGLSSALARDYGAAARFFTNRDGTFFSILAASQMREEPKFSLTTCCNPLGKKRQLCDVDSHASFAAAVSVCGVFTKVQDDAEDEAGVRKQASRIGAAMLQRNVAKARRILDQYGFPTREVQDHLDDQGRIEASSDRDWQVCAESTANAFGKIFAYSGKIHGRNEVAPLSDSGQALGRIIYLTDAYEDREEDEAKGRFNPVLKTKDQSVREWFEREFERLTNSFEKIELNRNSQLMNSILIDGLYSKSATILGMANGGSNQQKKKKNSDSWWDRWCTYDCCYCCDGCSGCGDCSGGGKKGGCDCTPDCDCNCCPCDCS